jgi:hypothetical protein
MNARQQVWIQAWCAVANANDCKENEVATTWADKALKAFDARFGNEKQPADSDQKTS